MKKKEIIIIGVIFAVVAIGTLVINMYRAPAKEEAIAEVRYKDGTVLLEFNVDEDGFYEVTGDVGVLHIEVKDSMYRVVDVDCPNKLCEKEGWIAKGSIREIVCLPNGIYIVQK